MTGHEVSVVLFGPQTTWPPPSSLRQVREALLRDRRLEPMLRALREFRALWNSLVSEEPTYKTLPALEALDQLEEWLDEDTPFSPSSPTRNLVLTPFTVMIHIIQYLSYLRINNLDHVSLQHRTQSAGIHGYCVGFLSAIAVNCAEDEQELIRFAASAMQVAFCIGAVVDLDRATRDTVCFAVRCDKTRVDKLRNMISDTGYISAQPDSNTYTVTIARASFHDLQAQLSDARFEFTSVLLEGRWHVSDHCHAAETLIAFLKEASPLPSADHLRSLLRSGIDGNVVTDHCLTNLAVNSILVKHANWNLVLEHILAVTTEDILAFGLTQPIASGMQLKGDVRAIRCGLEYLEPQPEDSIAIVGMACKFPGGDSMEEFWSSLLHGASAHQEVPEDRVRLSGHPRSKQNKRYWGNFINNPADFDHTFFGRSSREAAAMDPQQRLLLETTYQALASSGNFDGGNVGCFIGCAVSDYYDNIASNPTTAFSALGALRSFLAGRLSHFFGWTGPSITLDTACSSSMVAVDAACKALRLGDCSAAVAGGVNIISSPFMYQNLAAGSFLSPTGPSKAFDASADGYCRGEGAGVVVLKRYSQALKDNDNILGVIAATAVNQSANTGPITAPQQSSQAQLFKRALESANLAPEDITYVEAHGTGTQLGDPIEVASIREVFGASARPLLHLGAVKSNIGHTEAAAGVASLIKVLLMMHHKLIPPQAHFKQLSPSISPLGPDGIEIARRSCPWTSNMRAACVNNYGASGNNAALILREAPARSRRIKLPEYPVLVTAHSAHSLHRNCEALKKYANENLQCNIADLAHSISKSQNLRLPYRTWLRASCPADIQNLKAAGITTTPKRVVLVFGGQVPDAIKLEREISVSPSFRKHIEDCEHILRKLGQPSILSTIATGAATSNLTDTHVRLFAIQYASAKAWIDTGLQPYALIGHSFGQLTALCVSGSVSLADMLKLIIGRAQLMQEHATNMESSMLAVHADRATTDRIVELARQHGADMEITCYNGPYDHVVGGRLDALEITKAVISKHFPSTKAISLKLPVAYHSRYIDPILPGLLKIAEKITFEAPRIHLETCSPLETWKTIGPSQILEHAREPVHFGEAASRLHKTNGPCLWLEAGSSSNITKLTKRVLDDNQNSYQAVQLERFEGCDSLVDATVALWNAGHPIQFWPYQSGHGTQMILPPYQFDQSKHWLSLGEKSSQVPDTVQEPQLLSFSGYHGDTAIFTANCNHRRFQDLVRGHPVLNMPLCPASVYVEMATHSVLHLVRGEYLTSVEDLQIQAPLGANGSKYIALHLAPIPQAAYRWSFKVVNGGNETHASGTIVCQVPGDTSLHQWFDLNTRKIDTTRLEALGCDPQSTVMHGPLVYRCFAQVVRYSSYYRGIQKFVAKGDDIIAAVAIPETKEQHLGRGVSDPIASDNFLQVAGFHANYLNDLEDEVYVATKIGQIRSSSQYQHSGIPSWLVYAQRQSSTESTVYDIFVLDSNSKEVVLTVLGVQFTCVRISSLQRTLSRLTPGKTTNTAQDPQGLGPIVSPPKLNIEAVARSDLTASKLSTIPERTITADDPLGGESDIFSRVKELLDSVLDITVDSVGTPFEELGVDSLMAAELLTEIQDCFGLSISASEFQTLSTVDKLCQYLAAKLPDYASSSPTSTDEDSCAYQTDSEAASPASSVSSVEYPDDNSENCGQASIHCFRESRNNFEEYAAQTGFARFWSEVYPSQLRLVILYIVEALAELGCPLRQLEAEQRLPEVQVLDQHQHVLARMKEILQESGIIDGDVRTSCPIEECTSDDFYRELLIQYPQYAQENQLLHQTGSKLASCLSGEANAVNLLFGSREGRELLQAVYADGPLYKAVTKQLADFLVKSFTGRVMPLNILEVGAGTGGTTEFVVQHLQRHGIPFNYTFTDISASLVAKARKRFSSYDNMSFAVLDIESPPPVDLQNQAHIVLSTNCIHATKDLVKSSGNILQMLRSDGLLVLTEFTKNLAWFDLVFGLLDGWWLFNDGRTHALANENFWEKSLRRAGFGHVDWTGAESTESQTERIIAAWHPKAMSSGGIPKATSLLVRGSSSSPRRIFAFPGGFGTSATYLPVPEIADDTVIVGLNSPFLKNPTEFDVELDELASLFRAEIKRTQPSGPYLIMGYSAGGVIAYETTRQLIQAGDEVEHLFLVDSADPLTYPPFPMSLLDFFDSIDRFGSKEEEAHKPMTDPHVKSTIDCLANYRPLPLPSGCKIRGTLLSARDGVDKQNRVPRPKVAANELALLDWVLNDRQDFETSAWSQLIGPEFSIAPISGNHFSVMKQPHVGGSPKLGFEG